MCYIGRCRGERGKWGNPFSNKNNTLAKYKTNSREESIEKYKEWITKGEGTFLLDSLDELLGKKLGCFCKPKSCQWGYFGKTNIWINIIKKNNKNYEKRRNF